jgi:predicted dehydrogenase
VEEARLTAICDLDENNLKKAAAAVKQLYNERAEFHRSNGCVWIADLLVEDCENLKLYSSIDDMLKSEKLDFVDIIIPCEHHTAAVKKSIDADCHVICEKPLVMTWPEAEELVGYVEKSGKILLYGENLIYADPYHDVRKLIQKGEVGELETIHISFSISEPGNYSYANGGVGALLDNGIHAITLAWFLAGFDYIPKRVKSLSPDGVSVRIKERLLDGAVKKLDVEDYANFVVEFEDPENDHWVNAYLEASWSFDDTNAFSVIGSRGEIKIKDGKIEIEDHFGNSHIRNAFHPGFFNMEAPPGYGGHAQQLKSMVRLVKGTAKPLCDAEKGAESLAIAQAVYLSEARGRKAVTLSEFKNYAKKFNSEALRHELLETGIRKQEK